MTRLVFGLLVIKALKDLKVFNCSFSLIRLLGLNALNALNGLNALNVLKDLNGLGSRQRR